MVGLSESPPPTFFFSVGPRRWAARVTWRRSLIHYSKPFERISQLSVKSVGRRWSVYFWNIESLKSDLCCGRVSDRDALYYVLWLGGLTTISYSVLSLGDQNVWDHVNAAFSLAAFLVGVPYVFRRNGGSASTDFLLRFVSLGWVFGIRFLVRIGIPVIIAALVLEKLLLGEVPDVSTPYESLAYAGLEVAYFLLLGTHMFQCSVEHTPSNKPMKTDVE